MKPQDRYDRSDKGRATAKRWREANPEKARAQDARYRNSINGRATKERWLAANQDKVDAREKRWREAHPEEYLYRSRAKRYGLSISKYVALVNRPCDI